MSNLTVSFTIEVQIDEREWAANYGVGDAYDEAIAQKRRSLVADVEDYVLNQITQSAAALEGAIKGADITREGPSG